MGDYPQSGSREIPPNNQYFSPFINIPPPPLPPRFPTTNNAPPLAPPAFPPLSFTNYYPSQPVTPLVSSSPVHSAPSWDISRPSSEMVVEITQNQESSQNWVDRWTKNKQPPKVVKNNVKIYAVKEKINTAFRLVKELENGARTLGVMVKTVSVAEWRQKCDEVEGMKKKLGNALNDLKLSEEEFEVIRKKCTNRAKKRNRQRKKSEKLKNLKEEENVKIQNLHFQIDNWHKEMQEGVERVKREEELKKEADAVLWGVTQKKTETKRQVAMLSALLTLRSVRVARLTAAGQSVSQSQIDTFNTVIERLRKMWSHQLQECLLEEQALRGMLSNADTTTDTLKTHKRLVLHEWENAIFGSIGTLDASLQPDELVNTRCTWDQFAVSEPSILASSVPPGYVLPVPPSSDLWRSLLKYEK